MLLCFELKSGRGRALEVKFGDGGQKQKKGLYRHGTRGKFGEVYGKGF